MLDANLEWGLTGADAGFDTIEAMVRLMDSYTKQFDRVTDEIAADLSVELGNAAGLFELSEDATDLGLGRLSDTLSRVDTAVDAVVTGFSDDYTTVVENTLSDRMGAIYNAVTAAVDVWNNDIERAEIVAAFDADDLRGIFGLDTVLAGNQASLLSDLVLTMSDTVLSADDDPATDQNREDMADAIRTAFADEFFAQHTAETDIDLTTRQLMNVEVDGQDIITFTNGASTSDVSVEVFIPQMETILDALGHHPDLNMPLPDVFGFGSTGNSITFDLTAQNNLADPTASLGLTVGNFGGQLFSFGDPAGTAWGQDVKAGYLSGTLDTVSTAGLQLAVNWGGSEFAAEVEIRDSDTSDDVKSALGTAGFDFQIQEIGTNTFANVDANSDYELARFDLTTELNFGLGSTSLVSFGTTLAVHGNLATLGATQTTSGLFDASRTQATFDTSVVAGTAQFQAQIAQMAETMYNTSAETFATFLAALGVGTANLLTSDELSVGIPLTDLNVMDGFDSVADLFASLSDSFTLSPEQLGFVSADSIRIADGDVVPISSFAIEREITEQTGIVLDEAALDKLRQLGTLELEFLTSSTTLEGTIEGLEDVTSPADDTQTQQDELQVKTVTVDFRFDDANAADFLDQMSIRFNQMIGAEGWGTVVENGALKFVTSDGKLFRLGDSTDRSNNAMDFDFADLGFTDRMLRQIDGVTNSDANDTSADAVGSNFDVLDVSSGFDVRELSVFDESILLGMETLRLNVSVNGVPQAIDVNRPATGWSTVEHVQAAMQSAFTQAGIGIDVGVGTAPKGLTFTHDLNGFDRYVVSLDEDSLSRVQSLSGMLAWVNDKLTDLLPGASLDVYVEDDGDARAGDIRLTFDPYTATTFDDDQSDGDPNNDVVPTATLDIDDLGLGDFENLDVTGTLEADIDTSLELSAKINLYDMQAEYAAQAEAEKSILEAVLKSASLTDMSLTADFDARATAYSGTAGLGLMELGLGQNTPGANFAVFNASLDVTVVGEDNGAFGPDVSFRDFLTIFGGQVQTGTDASGDAIIADVSNKQSLANLIGRFNLTGNIVTDEDGYAMTDGNAIAKTAGAVDIFDADTETLDAGETRSMAYFGFGDLSADLGGIEFGGSTGGDIGLSIGNIFDPIGTAKFAADLPDLDCLVPLAAGSILDGLAGMGDLIDAYSDQLASQLSFLATDIPLLNASLLDGLDFTSDFLAAIDALRADPDFSLSTVEAVLQETFGGEVSLTFEDCVLKFDMSLAYLVDYEEVLGFNLSLTDLMSTADLTEDAGALADILTNLVDARGDAELVFDPDIFLDLSFGLDLSEITPTLTQATVNTPLSSLASVYTLRLNEAANTADLRVTWDSVDANGENPVFDGVNVDLNGKVTFDGDGNVTGTEPDATTIQDVVDKLNEALSGEPTISAEFDATTGQIKIVDSNTSLTDDTDVTTLFGAATADSDAAGEIALATSGIGYASAYSFDVLVNGGDPVNVSVEADAARTTIEDFAAALNEAMLTSMINRTDLSDTGIPFTQVALFQLLRVHVDGSGNLVLATTDFDDVNGFDETSFSVQGSANGHTVNFTVTDLAGSNAATALGFASGVAQSDSATSATLYNTPDIGRPIVYVDTDATAMRGEVTLGAPDGLNIILALGPVEAAVEGGKAFLGSSTGEAGYIEAKVLDVDGTDDGRLDLVSLVDIANDADKSFLDLFGVEIDLATNVDLPFSGAFGLLNPAQHGFTYNAALVQTHDGNGNLAPVTFNDLYNIETNEAGVRALFQGDAVELFYSAKAGDTPPRVPDDVDYFRETDLRLPDLSAQLGCTDIFQLLNDPNAVLNGLDMIFATIHSSIDTFLGDVDLPIIGDNLMQGANFFRDLQFDVIDPARDWIAELNADGEVRTTEDLVEFYINDYLQKLYQEVTGSATNQTFITLHTSDADPDDPYIYGAIEFKFEIFKEELDIGFNLDIPGLEFGVDDASAITLSSDLEINLGFGLDCNGFFVLNDTTDAEMQLILTADAGDFQGEMNIGGILGLEARANPETDPDHVSGAYVQATMGIDLFGEAGEEGRDYTGLQADYDKSIYVTQIDFGDFAEFEMDAQVHFNLALDAKVLDPFSGGASEFKVGGVSVFPSVTSNFEFDATYDPIEIGPKDLLITNMKFSDVTVDVKELYDGLLKPVLDPIEAALKPLDTAFDFLNKKPFNYVTAAAKAAFPILGVLDSISSVAAQFSGGEVCIGTYNFLGYEPGGEVLMRDFNIKNARFEPCIVGGIPQLPSLPGGNFDKTGLIVEVPLLTDPTQAFKLLTGDFASVDLVTMEFLLLDADFEFDLARDIVNGIGLPGWASSAIRNAFDAYVAFDLYAGFKVGYDMSGIVSFANSLDPIRLLDGAYINAEPGSLVSVDIDGRIGLSAGIAGASAALGVDASLNFNDPNDDGRLRLTEMVAMFEALPTVSGLENQLGVFFEGHFNLDAALRIWAGINLPWPLPDLRWSTTVFDLSFGYTLNGTNIGGKFFETDGGTSILNVGARASASLSDINQDGNEKIVISGTTLYLNDQNKGNTGAGAGGIIIPAGDGTNTVDLSALAAGVPTVTYTGKGNDTIKLAGSGVHVVFAGDGADKITGGGADGTYIIFAEGGADDIDVTGRNVVVISGDSMGMRDRFLKEFSGGGLTEAKILSTLGLQLQGGNLVTVSGGSYKLSGDVVNSEALLTSYTAQSQLNADRDDELIKINGNGNHIILTGKGADKIEVSGIGTANANDIKVFSGAGDDQLTLEAATVLAEGGAGEDLFVLGTGNNTAWGWGAQGEDDALKHLVRSDGDDIIVGNLGSDTLHGQYGRDVISGGLGDDILSGGYDNDLISGGVLEVSLAVTAADGSVSKGRAINLSSPSAFEELQNRLYVETEVTNDGTDAIDGGDGSDVLFGGAGNDDMSGGASADILVGDYGQITISANRMAETFISTGMNAAGAGIDILNGGAGNDILVAGGSEDDSRAEEITDLLGNNIIFGDFGETVGTRILETVTAYRTLASDKGTEDIITTGSGNDVILGGEQSDTITSGTGADFVLGDSGEYVVAEGVFRTVVSALDGDDVIEVGKDGEDDKLDIIMGGAGADMIDSVNGGVIALGDYGTLNLNPAGIQALLNLGTRPDGSDAAELAAYEQQLDLIAAVFKSAQSDAHASSGGDTLTVDEGLTYAILGGGSDTATLGDGLTYLVADDGTLAAVDATNDKEAHITAGTTAGAVAAGNDTITTAQGRDIILGGDGADSIIAGAGLNIVLTDNGTAEASIRGEALPTQITSQESAADGADYYEGSDDADFVILGGDGDTASVGNGLNYVLGDNGGLNAAFDATGTEQTVTVATEASSNTGNETLIGGRDRDVLIGGGGSDTIQTGADITMPGTDANAVLGDNGRVTARHIDGELPLEVEAVAGSNEGDDSVDGGNGIDIVALGLGADTATLYNGNNRVLGDLGSITTNGKLGMDETRSSNPDQGGDDTITTGTGADVVVAGEGADSVITDAGGDIVLGDAGVVSYAGAGGEHSVSADITDHGGNDFIQLGTGNDFAVAGLGDDSVEVGEGDDFAAGDLIDLTFRNTTDLETISLSRVDAGGNDTLTAEGTNGDNILMGQFGEDVIIGGLDDDWLIGDLAIVELTNVASALPGQSPVDRVALVEHTESQVAFDDDLNGSDGADFLLGGFGADKLTGELGQDFLFGDTVKFERELLSDGTVIAEKIELETNLPFVQGGTDELNGGDGPDVVIGGLGPDLFIGNTEDDVLIGDSFAGTFSAFLVSGSASPAPGGGISATERELVTGNFPGFGPTDILSGAQYRAAIGVYFSTSGFLSDLQDLVNGGDKLGGVVQSSAEILDLLTPIMGFVQSPEVIQQLALLLQYDTDPELIEEELLRAFEIYISATGGEVTPLQLELFYLMMQRILEEMQAQPQQQAVAEMAAQEAA